MYHEHYGRLPNIYYHKHSNRFYVRYKRQGQFFTSPYYPTVEEAIQARKEMLFIVPESQERKHSRKKFCRKQTNWTIIKHQAVIEQHITNTNFARISPTDIQKS